MSQRVEWMSIEALHVALNSAPEAYEMLAAADDPKEGLYVLTLAADEVTAIEGTLEELALLGTRIRVLVNQRRQAEFEARREARDG